MAQFDERARGEEARFAHDAELQFRAVARRNKLLGLWGAEMLSLSGTEAASYAAEVVAADFTEAGEEDVFRKLATDFQSKGLTVPEAVIRQKMAALVATAREQILNET